MKIGVYCGTVISILIGDILRMHNIDVDIIPMNKKISIKNIKGVMDILIMDIEALRENGYKYAKDLSRAENCTVIALKNIEDDVEDKIKFLENGIVNFLEVPFYPEELVFFVRNINKHNRFHSDRNPLTGLPGNAHINNEISRWISEYNDAAIIYIDLDNFKAYNDVYGFANGDLMLKLIADISKDVLYSYGTSEDFIGHIGGDDFIIITRAGRVEKICNGIIRQFDEKVIMMYNEDDRQRGYIVSKDRDNERSERQYRFVSVSMAVVTNENRSLHSVEHVSRIAADVKKVVKKQDGSCFLVDRRKADRE